MMQHNNSMRRCLVLGAAFLCMVCCFYLALAWGTHFASPAFVYHSLMDQDIAGYEQAALVYQRLPRALIALYVGAVMASTGLVFQTLIRNPLASSSTLGVNAGATFFVVAGALVFNLDMAQQGFAALFGGLLGFCLCVFVARLAATKFNNSALSLVLAGALVAILLTGLGNSLLLAFPMRRSEFLSWLVGNISHVYSDRLYQFWWIGVLAFWVLFSLSKPLTLLLLGRDKAVSMGVKVSIIAPFALCVAIFGASACVAVCGPIGFIGLVVPHMTRPLVGQNFLWALPASAFIGAVLCLLAMMIGQNLFQPFILNTGIMLDLLGGIVFIILIRKFYIVPMTVRGS